MAEAVKNVIELVPAPADAAVVDLLEQLLSEAKAGKITALAIAAECRGGDYRIGHSCDGTVFGLIGAMRMVERRLLDLAETAED